MRCPKWGVIYKLKLMRPKHWLKNVLIFIPLVFSRRLFELGTLNQSIGGFFAFSFLSSGIYILNDIQDMESDQQHEIKKNRPIAAGKVSISSAYTLLAISIAVAILLNNQFGGGVHQKVLF